MSQVEPASHAPPCRTIGRYALYDEISSGGMASVHFGRLIGPVGFARTVAIKRLHPHLASDEEFVAMFVDEARLAARVQHPNVVAVLDVVLRSPELFLVMEYVHGESLSRLVRTLRKRGENVPVRIASAIVVGALHGLHAAHEAKNERGDPMRLVHRDVSPQNVLVGADGVARIGDFGVAKAIGRLRTTRGGQLTGKAAYLAPEQVAAEVLDRRTDVYAASVVLWELLTGQRLFQGADPITTMQLVMKRKVEPPSRYAASLPKAVDEVVLRGLENDREDRFATARQMAIALEQVVMPATSREVGEWVNAVAADILMDRAARVAEIESASFTEDPQELEFLKRRRAKSLAEDIPTVQGWTPPAGLGSSTDLSPPPVPRPTTPPRRRTRLKAMAALVAALVTSGLALAWLASRSNPQVPASTTPSAAAAGPITSDAPRASSASRLAAESPHRETSPPVTPQTASRATSNHKHYARTWRRPAQLQSKKPNCADPFVWTSDGRKIPRPECF